MTKPVRIALDAMGGDFAPLNEIQGAIAAAKILSSTTPVEIIFIGKEKEIRSALAQFDTSGLTYSFVNAEDVVTMDDEPSTVIKRKRGSSLYRGVELHANGYADAFVSAGNTGAVMATATLILGRINGVSRPTIGSFIPTTQKDRPTLVLDVGANIESKPRHLYEFAVMGSTYVTQIFGIEHPKVGLLNIGEEKTKGTEAVLQAFELLEQSSLNFIGNIEGRDILHGVADVVVCDGFVGNIVLKFAESVMVMLKAKLRSFAERSIFHKIAVGLSAITLKKIFKELDYQEYGGVPLLGVNGVVIIGHGKSSPKALQNMIIRAAEVIQKDVNRTIERTLNAVPLPSGKQ